MCVWSLGRTLDHEFRGALHVLGQVVAQVVVKPELPRLFPKVNGVLGDDAGHLWWESDGVRLGWGRVWLRVVVGMRQGGGESSRDEMGHSCIHFLP